MRVIEKKLRNPHKGSAFRLYKVDTEKFCCTSLQEYGEAKPRNYFNLSPLDKAGMFLALQGMYEPIDIRIDYCPFCGEKIEVVVK